MVCHSSNIGLAQSVDYIILIPWLGKWLPEPEGLCNWNGTDKKNENGNIALGKQGVQFVYIYNKKKNYITNVFIRS